MQPVFLTCALVGNFSTRAQNENLPITPQELATQALEAAKAGAAIVHVHVRDPATGMPSMEVALYREVVDRIRQENDDLIINLTTGNGGRFDPSPDNPVVPGPRTNLLPPDARVEHILALKPDIATLDLNTMVFGGEVVINTLPSIRRMAELIQSVGVRPEIELFDSGDISILNQLMSENAFDHTPLCSIVTGVKHGFVPLPETLIYARNLLPKPAIWTGFGTGAQAFPMVAQSALLGGNVRIGMEDAVWLGKGEKAPSNAAMVLKASRLLEDLGFPLMSPAQARAAIGL
ncbi:3-keto-5-aminohexanoate cleavage protein [Pseudooceanicola sp. 216_PA32_1]|uniref:3-keto-5-aminohexanoate cleavage protein n=2 Tax=Pseudooceanicola pacificus TaxID=2676438 RepID=A0A844WEG7_9RHOB|nr:3-keto-5-aminohexanoate cleavage protein [Pseudooceanicola pacificus]